MMSKLLIEIELGAKAELSVVEYKTSQKFYKDKVDIDSDRYRVILDGVFVNRVDLCAQYRLSSWSDLILELIAREGLSFHEKLRGSYYGFVFDKQQGRWILFGDAINSKPLFYSIQKDCVLCSNNIFELVRKLRGDDRNLSVSIGSSYDLLSKGFMSESYTIMDEIKRLRTGFRLKGHGYETLLESYHKISFEENHSIQMEDAIEIVDDLFLKAVDRNYQVDRDYGYRHIASLSGGLDSRMTVMMAHKMGYQNQLNFTFAQKGCQDQKVASQIAKDLKHEWIYQSLDNGEFLKNIDDVTSISQGLSIYFGFSHGYSMVKNLNLESYGVVHTGLVGGEVVGSNSASPIVSHDIDVTKAGHSMRFMHKQNPLDASYYDTQEQYIVYTSDIGAYSLGANVYHQYTESLSPFLDLTFMEAMYQIPLSLRYDHRLYKKWILSKHPEVAQYRWAKLGCKITSPLARRLTIGKYSILWKRIPAFVLKELGLRGDVWDDKRHMNPLNYYYKQNEGLRDWMHQYVKEHIDLLDFDKTLKKDCETLFKEGNCLERKLSLTLLGLLKALDKC
ncbi:asparagine synthase-related protein [Prolixibacteraceae bacterium]|nr:asparagine synthase-related protein [Prolixibacteraceae bacterium]